MRTVQRTRSRSAANHRGGGRPRRVPRPFAGQCFEIETDHIAGRWIVRVPEIDETTEASSYSAVESAARECISAHTGIPMGYISVWIRD